MIYENAHDNKKHKICILSTTIYFIFLCVAGKPFDTAHAVNYAVSNIICNIVYGSRFEYDDPQFTTMVDRANESIRLVGSPSVQVPLHIFISLLQTYN